MEVASILQEVLMFAGIVSAIAMIYAILTYVKIKVGNKHLNDAIDIVLDAVDKVSQTFVDQLKKQGNFTPEKQKEAFEKAVKDIKEQMTDQVLKYIEKNFCNVDLWIKNKIESYIKHQHPELEDQVSQRLNG